MKEPITIIPLTVSFNGKNINLNHTVTDLVSLEDFIDKAVDLVVIMNGLQYDATEENKLVRYTRQPSTDDVDQAEVWTPPAANSNANNTPDYELDLFASLIHITDPEHLKPTDWIRLKKDGNIWRPAFLIEDKHRFRREDLKAMKDNTRFVIRWQYSEIALSQTPVWVWCKYILVTSGENPTGKLLPFIRYEPAKNDRENPLYWYGFKSYQYCFTFEELEKLRAMKLTNWTWSIAQPAEPIDEDRQLLDWGLTVHFRDMDETSGLLYGVKETRPVREGSDRCEIVIATYKVSNNEPVGYFRTDHLRRLKEGSFIGWTFTEITDQEKTIYVDKQMEKDRFFDWAKTITLIVKDMVSDDETSNEFPFMEYRPKRVVYKQPNLGSIFILDFEDLKQLKDGKHERYSYRY